MRLMVMASLIIRRCGIVLVACSLGAFQPRAGLRSFKSQTQGYVLQYPSSWYPHIVEDVFYIENFPPSRAVRAERLPPGGAGIKVLTASRLINGQRELPKTLEEWSAIGVGRRTVIQKRPITITRGQRVLSVIEVKTLCCAVAPFQESIEWFFEVDGQMFVGLVVYWQGDFNNADKLRDTLRDVVLSLIVNKPLGHAQFLAGPPANR